MRLRYARCMTPGSAAITFIVASSFVCGSGRQPGRKSNTSPTSEPVIATMLATVAMVTRRLRRLACFSPSVRAASPGAVVVLTSLGHFHAGHVVSWVDVGGVATRPAVHAVCDAVARVNDVVARSPVDHVAAAAAVDHVVAVIAVQRVVARAAV